MREVIRGSDNALLPLSRYENDSRPLIKMAEAGGTGDFIKGYSTRTLTFNVTTLGQLLFGGFQVNAQSANYVTLASDFFIAATGGAPGHTITLTASPKIGQMLWIAKVDAGAGTITVSPNTGQAIYGAGVSGGNVALSSQGNNAQFIYASSGVWIQK